MSIRRGMRSTIKWGGAVVTVLLLLVWVAEIRAHVALRPTIAMGFEDREFRIGWFKPWSLWPASVDAGIDRENHRIQWRFKISNDKSGMSLHVPMWFLVSFAVIPTTMIWTRDRKPVPNTCPNCGYSRTGLAADRACPECGTVNQI